MSRKASFKNPWLELTKPRIVTMVLVTTSIGYVLGGKGIVSGAHLGLVLLGTALAAAGSAVLNNFLERDLDARMRRTSGRALPAGKIEPAAALAFGVGLVLCGVGLLAWRINLLTAFLVLLTVFLYVIVYTPLKRVTWLNTSMGAIPGAIPPMSGWTAATGELGLGAWVLFLILFAWQHPHFYAITWMYRADYEKAGFKMLSSADATGERLCNHMLFYSVALLLISVLPGIIGMTGPAYIVGAVMVGSALLTVSLVMTQSRTVAHARNVLRASVIYFPLLLMLIVADGLL